MAKPDIRCEFCARVIDYEEYRISEIQRHLIDCMAQRARIKDGDYFTRYRSWDAPNVWVVTLDYGGEGTLQMKGSRHPPFDYYDFKDFLSDVSLYQGSSFSNFVSLFKKVYNILLPSLDIGQ